MPAGPVSTTRPRLPWATRRTASASWASSRSRPTNAMARRIDAACNILRRARRPRTAPHRLHPDNTLNELSGEEWLYFTKSLLTTAYPSELGHAARKAHGANKPPRLMARLIEFFTKPGELVLDPFAGVGGTLLGAAICRSPRRALGFEIEPRWAAVYAGGRGGGLAERDGAGPLLRDLGDSDPGGPRSFDPSGCRLRDRRCAAAHRRPGDGSVDLVATDPPYNPQLKIDDGRWARWPSASPTGGPTTRWSPTIRPTSPTAPPTRSSSSAWGRSSASCGGCCASGATPSSSCATPTRTGATASPASDLAARAEPLGLVPKGDLIWYQAGTRLRPYGYPHAFVPNIVHQHILVLRAE